MPHKTKKQRMHDLVADSAQSLLANIRFTDVDHPIHTVVITSSIPNEGKTFVSVNLAKAMAGAGRTCLLVEGDLRKRSLAATIGVHPRHGIYSVISGRRPIEEVAAPTAQKGLFFLDAEPRIPDPPDFLGSEHYERFLADMADRFDYVVIDTPPVGTFVDAAVVAAKADATFLVLRENFTKRNILRHAVEQLTTAGARVKGVIMNDCDTTDANASSYYGYYEYYSKDGKDGEVSAAGSSSFRSSTQQPAVPQTVPAAHSAAAAAASAGSQAVSASTGSSASASASAPTGSSTSSSTAGSSSARPSADDLFRSAFLTDPPSPADSSISQAKHARHSRSYTSRS